MRMHRTEDDCTCHRGWLSLAEAGDTHHRGWLSLLPRLAVPVTKDDCIHR